MNIKRLFSVIFHGFSLIPKELWPINQATSKLVFVFCHRTDKRRSRKLKKCFEVLVIFSSSSKNPRLRGFRTLKYSSLETEILWLNHNFRQLEIRFCFKIPFWRKKKKFSIFLGWVTSFEMLQKKKSKPSKIFKIY